MCDSERGRPDICCPSQENRSVHLLVAKTKQRKDALESLGYEMVYRNTERADERFANNLKELHSYMSPNGDFDIPRDCCSLHEWLKNQLLQYELCMEGKPSLMTPTRAIALNQLFGISRIRQDARPNMVGQKAPKAIALSLEHDTGNENKLKDKGPSLAAGEANTASTRSSLKDCPLTANNHRRVFVKHNYHDHAEEVDTNPQLTHSCYYNKMRCNLLRFPYKLHYMLDNIERDGLTDVVSWQPHGRAFVVQDTSRFVKEVMPRYFQLSKISSFQRQLNLYGFFRLSRGADKASYYHELFLRGKPFLCRRMVRTKVKGTGIKPTTVSSTEPDFYSMSPIRSEHLPPRFDEKSFSYLAGAREANSLQHLNIQSFHR